MHKKASRRLYLIRFYLLFYPALDEFEKIDLESYFGGLAALQALSLLPLLKLLEELRRWRICEI